MSKKEKLTKDSIIHLLKTDVQEFNNFRKENADYHIDLTSVDLTGMNLCRANLSYTDLTESDLSFAYLHSANLEGANLSNISIGRADFSEANLTKAHLENTDFSNTILYGANLSGANMQGSSLSNAKVREVNFSNADLTDAKLVSIDLTGAIFTNAILHNTNFEDSDLSQVIGLETAKFNATTVWPDAINLPRDLDTHAGSQEFPSTNLYDEDKIVILEAVPEMPDNIEFLDQPHHLPTKTGQKHSSDHANNSYQEKLSSPMEEFTPLKMNEDLNFDLDDYKPPSILNTEIQTGIQEVKNQLEKQKTIPTISSNKPSSTEGIKHFEVEEKPKETKIAFFKPKAPPPPPVNNAQLESKIDELIDNVNVQLSSLSESLYVLTSAVETIFSEGTDILSKSYLDSQIGNVNVNLKKLFMEFYKVLGKISIDQVDNKIETLHGISNRVEAKLDLLAQNDVVDQIDQLIGTLEEEIIEYATKFEKSLSHLTETFTSISKHLTESEAFPGKVQTVTEINEMLINLESNIRLDQEALINKLDASAISIDNVLSSVDDTYSTLYQKSEEILHLSKHLDEKHNEQLETSKYLTQKTDEILETVKLSKDTHETVTKILHTIDLIKEIEGKVTTVVEIHKLLEGLETKIEHIDTIHPILSTLNTDITDLGTIQTHLSDKLSDQIHNLGNTLEKLVVQYQKGLEELQTIKEQTNKIEAFSDISNNVKLIETKLNELQESKTLIKYIGDLLNNVHSFTTSIPEVHQSLVNLQEVSDKILAASNENLDKTSTLTTNIEAIKTDINTLLKTTFTETIETLQNNFTTSTTGNLEKLEGNIQTLLAQLDIKISDAFNNIIKYAKEEAETEEKQYTKLVDSLHSIKHDVLDNITTSIKNNFDHIFKFFDSFNNKYENMSSALSQFKNELTVFTYKFAEDNSNNSSKFTDVLEDTVKDLVHSLQSIDNKVAEQSSQQGVKEFQLIDTIKKAINDSQSTLQETIQTSFMKFATLLEELEAPIEEESPSEKPVESINISNIEVLLQESLNNKMDILNRENKEFYNRLIHNLNSNIDSIQTTMTDQGHHNMPNEELSSVLEFLVDQTTGIKNKIQADTQRIDDLSHKLDHLSELVQLVLNKFDKA